MANTAVVILNYNGEKFLRQFLPSVVLHSNNAAIIVADNGSTDNSLLVLKNEFPQVRIIALDANYGFCGGYNKALAQIDADYFVLLNSDVEVTANWLSPLTDLLDTDASIAAVQPKVLSYNEKDKFEYAGAAGGMIDSLGYPFCRGRIFDHVESDRRQYDDVKQIFWATGACLVIRSKVYHQFGGLDEYFFAHMEEIDLCWKIHRTNQKVMYCGLSTVYHVGAGTLGYDNPRKAFLNFRNGLILIYKHLGSFELCYKFPFRLFLDWIASFVFLLKGKPKNCVEVFKAHVAFFNDLKLHRTKRRLIQQEYPSYAKQTIFQGLIIFNYYLKGRKTWKE